VGESVRVGAAECAEADDAAVDVITRVTVHAAKTRDVPASMAERYRSMTNM
jgi:hypothetical protein